jgi:hypothetical protein
MLGFNPWIIAGALCALLGVGTGGYLKGRSDGKSVVIAAQAKEESVRLETLQLAQLAAAEEIAKIQVVNRTVYAKATHEVIERPVYRDCVHSPDGLRAVNAALGGSLTAGEGELPRVDAAR